jgi:DNA repair exonuclease SbcCD ATPase subunit
MFFYFLPRAHAVIATVFLGLIFVPSVILFSASTAKRRVFDTQKELLEKYGTTDPIEIDQKLSSYEKLLSELSRQQSIIREMEDELAVIPSIPEETRRRICEVFPGLEDQSDMETGIRQAVSGALEVIERHSYARMLYHSAQQVVEALRSNTGMTYIGASENAVSQRRPSMPRSAIESRLEHLDRMLSSLRREAALLEGSMANDRNINELEAEAERLDLRLETLNMRYDAISLALDALGKADRLLRERFSPALNSQASGIFSAFTRRKYDKVLISREFSAMAGSGGSEGLRRALELSHGTVDQLYLAVRLALCRIVPPAGYNPPIILDDAFLAFDDVRLEAALDWLCEESKTRQVILFTCHRREGLYLTGRPGVLIQSVTRTSVTGKEC